MLDLIVSELKDKAQLKATVYEQCLDIFNQLKDVLSEISNDLNDMIEGQCSRRVRIEYRDRGRFEAECIQMCSSLTGIMPSGRTLM